MDHSERSTRSDRSSGNLLSSRTPSASTATATSTSTSSSLAAAVAASAAASSAKSKRSSRSSSTTTSTNTLIAVLVGLTVVGQILSHPALTHGTSSTGMDTGTDTTSTGSDHPLGLDPYAWQVSHHLAKKKEQETTSFENEVLGAKKPPAEEDYETVRSVESTPVLAESPKMSSTASSSGTQTQQTKMSNDPDPLLTMLQGAGLTNISAADLASLPTWEKLTQQYGDFSKGPMIVGMESCERYRQQVAQRRRYAAPGGMFNTGTNAAAFHLEHNLKAAQKWQLPWGKHREAKVRLSHTASGFDKAIKEDVMPIVMIRDPLHWMQSMCKEPYATKWPHSKKHCPNLVPMESETQQPSGAVPVKITFDKQNIVHWDSLVDLWNDWYRQYLQADYPRLIIRFEDLLFQAPAVMKQISDCMGVDFDATKFRYQTARAKGHGSGTDFLHAIIKSGNETARKKGMTQEDLKFAAQHLDADLMRIFQYQTPFEIA